MKRNSAATLAVVACAAMLCSSTGCGTTRTSNTLRTATEQLLISDAIDRAVQEIDFTPLAGKDVFFDDRHLYDVVDDAYLISTLRQHLLASGCILKEDREQATFIVESRAGAIGTDNDDLLFGIPQTNLPQITLLAGLPPAIPEIPIAKRRNQRGVAKIAVFAYRRDSGEPAWQSGIATSESTSNDTWILGAGPFKRGTIHEGTSFAGDKITKPRSARQSTPSKQVVQLRQEAIFPNTISRPPVLAQDAEGEIQQVALEEPVAATPMATAAGPSVLPPP
ncbi:MAG: hypothetical protein GXP28_08745 [Planctomycetes bacterium]|nr:hypothetical protein [Planctomycetota bacterium]